MSDEPVNPYVPPRDLGQMPKAAEDPVVSSSRREAAITFAIWLAACVYSIGVCYRYGYGRDVAMLTYILGFPDWIFYGVVLPWTVCTVLCFVMAYFVIADGELGEEQAEEQIRPRDAEADHA
jgi:uncharacterized membrane protein YhdT